LRFRLPNRRFLLRRRVRWISRKTIYRNCCATWVLQKTVLPSSLNPPRRWICHPPFPSCPVNPLEQTPRFFPSPVPIRAPHQTLSRVFMNPVLYYQENPLFADTRVGIGHSTQRLRSTVKGTLSLANTRLRGLGHG